MKPRLLYAAVQHLGGTLMLRYTHILWEIPSSQMASPAYSVFVDRDDDGQYHIHLTQVDRGISQIPGHGETVWELCTFSVETAEDTAQALAESHDPEAYCRALFEGNKIALHQAPARPKAVCGQIFPRPEGLAGACSSAC